LTFWSIGAQRDAEPMKTRKNDAMPGRRSWIFRYRCGLALFVALLVVYYSLMLLVSAELIRVPAGVAKFFSAPLVLVSTSGPVLAVVGILWIRLRVVSIAARAVANNGRICWYCLYDLRGAPVESSLCPECGHSIEKEWLRAKWMRLVGECSDS
jgi:hypothetical protein